METCANCGSAIGKLETPFVWSGQTVCSACFAKLKQAAVVGGAMIPYATPARRHPIPSWAWPLGGLAIVLLFIAAGGFVALLFVGYPAKPVSVPVQVQSPPQVPKNSMVTTQPDHQGQR